MSEDKRSELLLQKIEVDDRLNRMKAKLNKARMNGRRGLYLPPTKYESMQLRVTDLKRESQWLQMEIGKLKKQPIKEPS